MEAMCRSGMLERLEVLLLRACQLNDDALALMARSPHVAALRILDLGYNEGIGAAGLRALRESQHAQLEVLYLDHCALDEEALEIAGEMPRRVRVVT